MRDEYFNDLSWKYGPKDEYSYVELIPLNPDEYKLILDVAIFNEKMENKFLYNAKYKMKFQNWILEYVKYLTLPIGEVEIVFGITF